MVHIVPTLKQSVPADAPHNSSGDQPAAPGSPPCVSCSSLSPSCTLSMPPLLVLRPLHARHTFSRASAAPPPPTMSASIRSKNAADAAGAGLAASSASSGSRIRSA